MEPVVGLNRPGFDGGGDDRKDHCHGGLFMGCM